MDKSMTGDGAVVRLWEPQQVSPDGRGEIFAVDGPMIPWNKLWSEHNALVAHALAQAAEIERLTRERDDPAGGTWRETAVRYGGEAAVWKGRAYEANKRTEASEARNAALTTQSTADAHTIDTQGNAIAELSARTADLLKALERYGQHTGECDWEDAKGLLKCNCGLAAAKGETVSKPYNPDADLDHPDAGGKSYPMPRPKP